MFASRFVRAAFPAAAAGTAACAAAFCSGDSDESLFVVKGAMSTDEFSKFTVFSVKDHEDGTRRVQFSLGGKHKELGAAPSAHLVASVEGKEVKVTPVSSTRALGTFDVVASPADTDALSKRVMELRSGQAMLFKGPVQGSTIGRNQYKSLGIVARGTGVSQAVQVISHLLSDPRDDTEIRLCYSVASPAHLVLRNYIDALALIHPRFKATIVVDEGDASWDGPTGPLTPALLAGVLPPASEGASTAVLVAAEGGDLEGLVGADGGAGGALGSMKYSAEQVQVL